MINIIHFASLYFNKQCAFMLEFVTLSALNAVATRGTELNFIEMLLCNEREGLSSRCNPSNSCLYETNPRILNLPSALNL